MNVYGRSTDNYLAQRILGASIEQQAGLIMEAGQLHLGRAVQALKQNDHAAASRSFIRVAEVIMEATARLNVEDGGELVQNLGKLYRWWTKEIMDASLERDTARLDAIVKGMGEIREGWEQLHEQRVGGGASLPKSQFGDQIV